MSDSVRLPSLLLLPQPPSPASPETLSAAYSDALQHVFAHLQAKKPSPVVLVIAVAVPSDRPGRILWRRTQLLLARLYALIARVSSTLSVSTDIGADDPRSVDARVVLVDHRRKAVYYGLGRTHGWTGSSIRNLEAFASEKVSWETIYHPTSEDGYGLLQEYVNLRGGLDGLPQTSIVAAPGGISLQSPPDEGDIEENGGSGDDDAELYRTVCLGGTFDHLHPGHKLLLQASALLLEIPRTVSTNPSVEATAPATLIVGITGDELLKNKKHASELQSWSNRATSVLAFLSTLFTHTSPLPTPSETEAEARASFFDGALVVRCVNISDPFGPTITEEAVDAIVVSGETRSGGKAINDRRAEKGWKALRMYEIDVLDDPGLAENGGRSSDKFADKISSTAIRKQRAERKQAMRP